MTRTCLGAALLLLTACPSDDEPSDTDDGGSSSSDSDTTSTSSTSTSSTSTTTDASTTEGSTSEGSTSEGGTGSTSGSSDTDGTGTDGSTGSGGMEVDNCFLITDEPTCTAASNCEWFGVGMIGACTDSGGGDGSFCDTIDSMMICNSIPTCTYNQAEMACEAA